MYAIVTVVAPHTMVFAPSVPVVTHDKSSWRIGFWDMFGLIYFFQDSLRAHLKGNEMFRGVSARIAIPLRLSFEGSPIPVWRDVIVLAFRA